MTTTLAPAGFTQDTFDAFLASRNEPGWLTDLRQAAWKRFESLSLPTTRQEGWMRTDIRLLRLDHYGLLADVPHPEELPPRLLAAGVELAGDAVAVNSRPFAEESDTELKKQGVLFGSLDKLLVEHDTLLKPFFERNVVDPFQDKFSALNAACWGGGILLYVPKNVRVELPLHALSVLTDGGTDTGKIIAILESGAEATLMSLSSA